MNIDGMFKNLRQKLDALGYLQPLPLSAISLVSTLFEDLVKTTESLRDSKKKISELLDEKNCWELGIEPYKCDNSRLLAECNKLNLDFIKQKEEFEEIICDYSQKVRNLEADKRYVEEHCSELEGQVRELALKYSDTKALKNKKDGTNMSKKPAFVTTVRSGIYLPNPKDGQHDQEKCTKCHSILWKRPAQSANEADTYGPPQPHEIERLQNYVREHEDQVILYKKKVEARDREIHRLNDLLIGGRPAAALAKDCCYRNIGPLTEDLEILQREKTENMFKLRDYQDEMHEAKQRAVDLAEQNKRLENDLQELQKTALSVENQANEEIGNKEQEIEELKTEIYKLRKKSQNPDEKSITDYRSTKVVLDDKRKLNEKLNELTMKENEMAYEIDRIQKKNQRLKAKLLEMQKDSDERLLKDEKLSDGERLRLKSERDFFQKEYLNLIHRTGSEKEIEFLQTQIQMKDEELRNLRSELFQSHHQSNHLSHHHHHDKPLPRPCSTSTSTCTSPAAVQAAILRAEREKDVFKSELERVKLECDTLRERLQCITEVQYKESQRYKDKLEELNNKVMSLEKEKRELESYQIPGQTHIVLMKEEIEQLKKRIYELQGENCKLKTSHNQIKIIHDQTEKALVDLQNKYAVAETQLENAESRLNTLGTNRDSVRNEASAMKNEIAALKSINKTIDSEKDKIISELDAKTEKIYKLESDVKALNRKNKDLEKSSYELQEKYE